MSTSRAGPATAASANVETRADPPDSLSVTKDPRPYKCEIDVAFPTSIQAKHAKDVLSVDGELGDKVVKKFSLVVADAADEAKRNEDLNVMRVKIEATEAKMLRVSVSTFYDILKVVLKCFQEFGEPTALASS